MRIFLSLSILCILITSCQKQFENIDNNNLSGTNVADSFYISKTELYDSTGNTITKIRNTHYNYDALRRLSVISDTTFPAPGSGLNSSSFRVIYSGNDTLATGAIAIYFSDTTRYFYFYDSQNRRIKDSIVDNNFLEVHNISYLGQEIKIRKRFVNQYSQSDDTTTVTLDSRGNFQKVVTHYYNNPFITLDSTFISYDNMQNPFHKMKQCFPVNEWEVWELGNYLPMKNNIVSFWLTDIGSPIVSYVIHWYNPAGYPVKSYESEENVYLKYSYLAL